MGKNGQVLFFCFLFSVSCFLAPAFARPDAKKCVMRLNAKDVASYNKLYSKAVGCYEAKKFSEAEKLFNKVLAGQPDNLMAKVYLEKIKQALKNPPPPKVSKSERIRKEQVYIEAEQLKRRLADKDAQLRAADKNARREMAVLNKKIAEARHLNARLAADIKESSVKEKKSYKAADKALAERRAMEDEKNAMLKKISSMRRADKYTKYYLKKAKYVNNYLKERAKEFFLKSQGLEQAKKTNDDLLNSVDILKEERAALKKENDSLREKILLFEDDTRVENAKLYDELGNAYMQAGVYDSAADAYENSVKLAPGSAEAHYRLGLLYKQSRGDAKKAVYHLKKYLQLCPEAKNKQEVDYLIRMLSS